LEQVRWLITEYADRHLGNIIELAIQIARGGRGNELGNVLLSSKARENLEPLLIALEMESEGKEEP
jgi:hypothetical protein